MPKDKCIVCGKPCVGRFCYKHICEALERSQKLYQTDRKAWKAEVDEANTQERAPKGDKTSHAEVGQSHPTVTGPASQMSTGPPVPKIPPRNSQ